jgi:hypothetical protein
MSKRDERDDDAAIDPSLLMLGYLCVASVDDSGIPEKVLILDRFGLSNGAIARICGCKVQSVKNARGKARKTNSPK